MLSSPAACMATRMGRSNFSNSNEFSLSPIFWMNDESSLQSSVGTEPGSFGCYKSVQGPTTFGLSNLTSEFDVDGPPNCGQDTPATFPPLPKKLLAPYLSLAHPGSSPWVSEEGSLTSATLGNSNCSSGRNRSSTATTFTDITDTSSLWANFMKPDFLSDSNDLPVSGGDLTMSAAPTSLAESISSLISSYSSSEGSLASLASHRLQAPPPPPPPPASPSLPAPPSKLPCHGGADGVQWESPPPPPAWPLASDSSLRSASHTSSGINAGVCTADPALVQSCCQLDLVEFATGKGPTLSVGSLFHGDGHCRACDFTARGMVCRAGLDCKFCHLCGTEDRRKQRNERRRVQRASLRRS